MSSERTVRVSLSVRLSLLIFIVTLGTGTALTVTGYAFYQRNMERKYISLGQGLTDTAAEILAGEDLERYLAGGVDEGYAVTRALLRNLFKHNALTTLYVVKFIPDGSVFLFDASGEDEIPLGFLDPWNEGFPEEEKLPFLEGREIAPEIYNSNFGTVLTVHSPVRYSNGEAARGFYVAADFSMERLSRERQEFFLYLSLISLAVALAFALIHWYIVRRSVVLPVYALAGAAGEFLAGQDLGRDQRSSLRKLAALSIHTGDELQVLSESLAELEKRIWAYIGNLNDPGHRPVKDSQTGLHNRDALYNNVNLFIHRFHEGNYHAFWLFDLDRFKQLNETYGRASGDEAIRGCASALRDIFRQADEVARFGGDQFAAFTAHVGSAEIVEKKALQIKTAFAGIRPQSWAPGITVSTGIALFSDTALNFDELFRQAGAALSEVKAGGGNGYRIVRL